MTILRSRPHHPPSTRFLSTTHILTSTNTMAPPTSRKKAIEEALAREALKPLPSQEEIQAARHLFSQVYYGFESRPPVQDPDRQAWYNHFLKAVREIVRLLHSRRFEELPGLIIGTVWQYTLMMMKGLDQLDVEAITAGACARLPYKARNDGPLAYLSEKDVGEEWWISPGAQHYPISLYSLC